MTLVISSLLLFVIGAGTAFYSYHKNNRRAGIAAMAIICAAISCAIIRDATSRHPPHADGQKNVSLASVQTVEKKEGLSANAINLQKVLAGKDVECNNWEDFVVNGPTHSIMRAAEELGLSKGGAAELASSLIRNSNLVVRLKQPYTNLTVLTNK
jgi:hypothetical protein